jgi:hypothetical protein
MNEPPGARARVALTGLTVAEYFRDQEGQNVLLFIDNIFRFTQAGSEVRNTSEACSWETHVLHCDELQKFNRILVLKQLTKIMLFPRTTSKLSVRRPIRVTIGISIAQIYMWI